MKIFVQEALQLKLMVNAALPLLNVDPLVIQKDKLAVGVELLEPGGGAGYTKLELQVLQEFVHVDM